MGPEVPHRVSYTVQYILPSRAGIASKISLIIDSFDLFEALSLLVTV